MWTSTSFCIEGRGRSLPLLLLLLLLDKRKSNLNKQAGSEVGEQKRLRFFDRACVHFKVVIKDEIEPPTLVRSRAKRVADTTT